MCRSCRVGTYCTAVSLDVTLLSKVGCVRSSPTVVTEIPSARFLTLDIVTVYVLKSNRCRSFNLHLCTPQVEDFCYPQRSVPISSAVV